MDYLCVPAFMVLALYDDRTLKRQDGGAVGQISRSINKSMEGASRIPTSRFGFSSLHVDFLLHATGMFLEPQRSDNLQEAAAIYHPSWRNHPGAATRCYVAHQSYSPFRNHFWLADCQQTSGVKAEKFLRWKSKDGGGGCRRNGAIITLTEYFL